MVDGAWLSVGGWGLNCVPSSLKAAHRPQIRVLVVALTLKPLFLEPPLAVYDVLIALRAPKRSQPTECLSWSTRWRSTYGRVLSRYYLTHILVRLGCSSRWRTAQPRRLARPVVRLLMKKYRDVDL